MTANDFDAALGWRPAPPDLMPALGSAKPPAKRKSRNLVVWLVTGTVPVADALVSALWQERHPRSGKALTLRAADVNGRHVRLLIEHVVKGGWWSDVQPILDRHLGYEYPWQYEELARVQMPSDGS